MGVLITTVCVFFDVGEQDFKQHNAAMKVR